LRRLLRLLLITALLLTLAAIAVVGVSCVLLSRQPEWYQQALAAPPAAEKKADEFERRVAALGSDVRLEQQWEAVFTQAEINSFLATRLNDEFAKMLPAGVSDPRVVLRDGEMLLGARYHRGAINSILTVRATAHLTDNANEVAVALRDSRAGAVPIPLSKLVEEIEELAQREGIDVRLRDTPDGPVILAQLPEEHDKVVGRVHVKTIEVLSGEVYLAGRTLAYEPN